MKVMKMTLVVLALGMMGSTGFAKDSLEDYSSFCQKSIPALEGALDVAYATGDKNEIITAELRLINEHKECGLGKASSAERIGKIKKAQKKIKNDPAKNRKHQKTSYTI